ncbi:MAG TPA: response regulator transcription factor [Acidimicrobiales bacterium]|nr:response regulator transcription factor [Acidimicrobiales bacterium]
MAAVPRRPDGGSGQKTLVTRAAVVDALPLVWRGVTVLLDRLGVAVVAAGRQSGHVLREARQEGAGLIVIGRPAGGEAIESVRAAAALPGTPGVVALAATRDPTHVRGLLDAGASAVVSRAATEDVLIAVLTEAAAGRPVVAQDLVGALLAEAGGPRSAPAGKDDRPLVSAREQAVLEGLAAGLTNDQIAGRLFVSPATVKTHVSHLARKLGTSDRRSTVAAAVASGLLG